MLPLYNNYGIIKIEIIRTAITGWPSEKINGKLSGEEKVTSSGPKENGRESNSKGNIGNFKPDTNAKDIAEKVKGRPGI